MLRTKPALADQLAVIARDAAGRLKAEHTVYIVTLLPVQISAWGDIVEAIEGAGWTLEHFEIAAEGHAVAVFRAVH